MTPMGSLRGKGAGRAAGRWGIELGALHLLLV